MDVPNTLNELIHRLQMLLNEQGDLKVLARNGINHTLSPPEVLLKTRWDGTKYIEITGYEI